MASPWRSPHDSARRNRADYSGRGPNCNVAALRPRRPQFARSWASLACEHGAAPLREQPASDKAAQCRTSTDQASKRRPGRRQAGRRCLERIADALERLAPPAAAAPDFAAAEAFVWHPDGRTADAGARASTGSRCRCSRASTGCATLLLENTERFATRPAGQQRAAVGRARHGQVVAGQGRRTPRSTPRDGRAAPSSSSKFTARTSKACPT